MPPVVGSRHDSASHLAGIPGRTLRRALDGEECPIRNFCRLEGDGGRSLAAISADVFACDVQPNGLLRLTLLRTPFFAHHDPATPAQTDLSPVTDLGEHFYDVAILADAAEETLLCEQYRQTLPQRFTETTRGMG